MSNKNRSADTIVAPPHEETPQHSGRTYRQIQREMAGRDLIAGSTPFLNWLAGWQTGLPSAKLDEIVRDPAKTALVSVDMIVGFCTEGPLASPRINALVEPITELMTGLHDEGVSRMVLVQEWHDHDAPEFGQFGRHCVAGTREAETVEGIKNLPFADEFKIVHKNSINPAYETDFNEWLDAPEQSGVDTFVVVGDCTDLCTFQLAMHLKLRANAANRNVRVVVPVDCVQTFDIPVDVAEKVGILPHDGDLLHAVFLYSMAQNGCEVVKTIAARA